MNRTKIIFYTAFIAFTLSGFTGLVYQSIWSKYLGLLLGHAAYAQSLVLIIFMGGLAVGAAITARYTQSWRRLLFLYAAVEALVGLFALFFHSLFDFISLSFIDHLISNLDSPSLISAMKWAIAALLILPQTVLLGMTFPLMSAGLIRIAQNLEGRTLALLYFFNSFGASIGALIAIFFMVPRWGLPGTMAIAGLVNLILATVVAGVSLIYEPNKTIAAKATLVKALGQPPRSARILIVAAAITGLVSFMYEVAWVRLLSLALGSTIHSFELMLSAFILGLALGSWIIRRHIQTTDSPIHTLGYVQIAMGLTALVSVPLFNLVFGWVSDLMLALSRTDNAYSLFNLGSGVIAAVIMLPTALFAGMTLPLITHSIIKLGGGEPSIGRVYASNTLGAIIGVLFSVHIALPLLGIKLMMVLATTIDIALGVLLLRFMAERLSIPRYASICAISVAALTVVIIMVNLDPMRMASGVFRHGTSRLAESRMVFYKDGRTASISLYATPEGTLSIATNGKPDASISMVDEQPPTSDEVTMVLLAAVPLAMRENIRTVANIGFGAGLTSHTVLLDDQVERLDTIEIERAMYDAARGFGEHVRLAYEDPRSNIIFDDAKTVFSRLKRKYDVIISEPSNPWVSGVAGLFSKEWYRFLTGHLTEDGILVQWVQLYEINIDLVGTIIGALGSAYSDFVVLNVDDNNLLIMATNGIGLDDFARDVFAIPAMQKALNRVGLETLDDIRMRVVGDRELLLPLFVQRGTPANSDYYPKLSLEAPRARFKSENARDIGMLHTLALPYTEFLINRPIARGLPSATGRYSVKAARVGYARNLAAWVMETTMPSESETTIENAIPKSRARLAQSCPATGTEEHWAQTVHQLATDTLNFLPTETASRLWSTKRWSSCQLNKRHKVQLALYDAVARRDVQGFSQHAALLLADDMVLPEIRAFAYDAAQLGYYLTNDHEGLEHLRSMDSVPPTDRFRQYARELVFAAGAARTQP